MYRTLAWIRAFRLPTLPSIRPWLLPAAIVLWSIIAIPFAIFMALASGRTWVLLACAGGPLAMLLRHRPYLAGAAIIVAATILRLSWLGAAWSDPIDLSHLAAARAFNGHDPFGGFVYATGTAYSYGPLGLLTYQAGIPGELLATIGTSALLVWARSWMALALFNAWPQFIYMPAIGNNDFSVGFVLALALVLLRYRPRLAMVLLAAAVAIKPYAAAWALPAAAYAGLTAAIMGAVASLILWSPVLFVWGVPSYIASILRVEAIRGFSQAQLNQSWSFADIPILRLLVIPFSLAGLVWKSWAAMALFGTAGFLAFLGFSPWAHVGYIAVALPVIGLALEWRTGSLVLLTNGTGGP